jgi:hypothetical protein
LTSVPDALASFESALRIQPEHARSHYNQALAWLVSGDWERGWAEYEWRWKIREEHRPPTLRPRWTGCELPNKTLLVEAEQGLGDTIQFLRFVSVARQKVGRLVFRCQRPLIQLLEGVLGTDEVLADDDPPTSCDVWSPLLSLPNYLGTRLTSIPPAPYLTARPLLVERWRRELEALIGFRIGIQWQGNPEHPKDRFRSFTLQHFKTIANVPGVQLVSLQKGPGAEQLQTIDFPVLDFGARMDKTCDAFLDTAAVMQNLDLIITDSSIGHLAGALGRPTWILLSAVPEWRWLLERDDTPWYRTVRLFRQSHCGDWCEVFARIRVCLQSMIATDSLQKRREAG